MSAPSRRQFLAGGAGIAGAAAAVSAVAATRTPIARTVAAGPRREPLDTDALARETEYDYVVVGAGAGGGPLAVRLAEAGYSVLVVEAGPASTSRDVYEVPAFHLFASSDPEMSWDFFVRHYSDASKHGSAFVRERDGVLYPRASTLGGCTAHHAMLMLAPESDDWDSIGRITGDPSWNALAMLPFQRRVREWLSIEDSPASLLAADPVLSRLVVAASASTSGLSAPATAVDLVHGRVSGTLLDPNDEASVESLREGVTLVPQSTRAGRRYGIRERLTEAAQRLGTALSFQTDALVERVILDEGDDGRPRAVGLDVLVAPRAYGASPRHRPVAPADREGLRRRVRARREIILAAGAFNTPQLLMLSGIGPAGQLRRHGVEPVVDLPGVGSNLQDRYEMTVVTEFDRPFAVLQGKTYGAPGDPGLAQWRSGDPNALYRSNGILVGVKEKVAGGTEHPEIFLFGSPSSFTGYRPGFAEQGVAGGDHFTWAVVRGYQSSMRGSVRLVSADPTVPPAIDFGYFDDGRGGPASERDLAAVRQGLARARDINQRARSLRFADAATDREVYPGPEVVSDADLDAVIARDAWGHHASCTARMGADGDRMAVLDSKFRVRGVAGLRVVDASAFPRIPALFPLMTIFAASERAASEIIADAVRVDRTRAGRARHGDATPPAGHPAPADPRGGER
ncbi:Choline oxidase [Frondihabitans sp. 762G35]|uniref:GMC family oxidoreductase n=1 Tax=Frondihabitans sp. 762G35 TaxID=1446794 RepID=UPI000D223949|nr:GMC oxidoreductase [Frondihabitans sp. 762G35]ARC58456.1 Choline oxidase [Frondihabitans sp. 762G35]